ncbi:MAG: glycosyltransferase family 39 protein [Candidatus Eiseniibacteriota bacterium]|jgi:hypothetical protein
MEEPGPARRRALAALRPWLFLVVVIALAAALLAPYRHFTTDDAFIHFRFARHLARGDGFSYNQGVPTYGDTAPLWVLSVAPLGLALVRIGAAPAVMHASCGGMDAWHLAAKLLDAGAILLAVVCFALLARRRLGRYTGATLAACLLFVIDPWWVKWGMAGMETPLAVLLALAALRCRDLARDSGRVDVWTPLTIGVGFLVRPEMALFGVALVVDILANERRRRRADLVAALTGGLLPVVPWLVYAAATFGTVVPNTFAARQDVNYSLAYVVVKLGKILASAYAVPLVAIVVALIAGRRAAGGERWGRINLFPLLSIALVLGFYVGARVSVGARYVLLVSPFILLLGYEVLIGALDTTRARRVLRGAVLVAIAVLLLGVQVIAVRFVTRWPLGLDGHLFDIACFLRDETPPGAVVAAHEIGVLGHVSERPIVDLAALVSPDLTPYSRTGSVARSLGGRHVDYLVWNANEHPDRRLLDDMAGRLTPLLVRRVHREGSSHRGGWQYYTVYRVRP